MRARGALRERDGEWLGVDSPELSLPDSVRDAVDRRYGLLFDDAKRVLRIAAVIGQRFEFDLLAMVAEISREGLIEVLRSAIGAQLVVESDESGSFEFRHSLTRASAPGLRSWRTTSTRLVCESAHSAHTWAPRSGRVPLPHLCPRATTSVAPSSWPAPTTTHFGWMPSSRKPRRGSIRAKESARGKPSPNKP